MVAAAEGALVQMDRLASKVKALEAQASELNHQLEAVGAEKAATIAEANQTISNLKYRLETQQKSHQVLRLIETKVHDMMKRKLKDAQKQIRQRAATANDVTRTNGTQATTSTAGTQTESGMGLGEAPTRAVATTQTEPNTCSAVAVAAVTATAA